MADWNPAERRDPQTALVLELRALGVGKTVRFPDGTAIRSFAQKRGAHSVRRYLVTKPGQRLNPNDLKKHTIESASEAAQKALKTFDA